MTSPELSIAQNVKYMWLLGHLNVASFLDWARLDSGQLQLACALIHVIWANPLLNPLPTMATDLLSVVSSGVTNHLIWTRYLLKQQSSRLKLERTTLWTCFVCRLASPHKCRFLYDDDGMDSMNCQRCTARKETWRWFNSMGLPSPELMHITILLTWNKRELGWDVQFVPFFTMDDQGRGLEHTLMFEAFLAPPVLLPVNSSYVDHHDRRLTLRRSKPSRIVECAFPGNPYASLHHLPLDDRQSRQLLSEIETFEPPSFIYHEIDA